MRDESYGSLGCIHILAHQCPSAASVLSFAGRLRFGRFVPIFSWGRPGCRYLRGRQTALIALGLFAGHCSHLASYETDTALRYLRSFSPRISPTLSQQPSLSWPLQELPSLHRTRNPCSHSAQMRYAHA